MDAPPQLIIASHQAILGVVETLRKLLIGSERRRQSPRDCPHPLGYIGAVGHG
jgi:hypothetical protein